MANNFTPLKASEIQEQYRRILTRGDGIKIDGGAQDFCEIIPRNRFNDINAKENSGNGDFERIPRAYETLKKVLDALTREDYVVKSQSCEYSGWCQYHAQIYYLG